MLLPRYSVIGILDLSKERIVFCFGIKVPAYFLWCTVGTLVATVILYWVSFESDGRASIAIAVAALTLLPP